LKVQELMERFLRGETEPLVAEDEAAWHQLWNEKSIGALSPRASALQGGLLADRLPWVFVAAYQAAIRSVFPEVPRQGWAAFAATEDKHDPDAHPGTTLSETGSMVKLSGWKYWVAQSRHVDHLVVTARRQEGEQNCVYVERDQQGVTLTHREAPGFLGAMSQGFAKFEQVEIRPDDIYPGSRIEGFVRTEPPFVMLASSAFLLAQLGDGDAHLKDTLVALTLSLAELCNEPCDTAPSVPGTLAALDRVFQDCVKRFEAAVDPDTLPGWSEDRRLLSMYSRRIQGA
jgi:alkylation response protein AidB-like acyl-CoA dehydrogenase